MSPRHGIRPGRSELAVNSAKLAQGHRMWTPFEAFPCLRNAAFSTRRPSFSWHPLPAATCQVATCVQCAGKSREPVKHASNCYGAAPYGKKTSIKPRGAQLRAPPPSISSCAPSRHQRGLKSSSNSEFETGWEHSKEANRLGSRMNGRIRCNQIPTLASKQPEDQAHQ